MVDQHMDSIIQDKKKTPRRVRKKKKDKEDTEDMVEDTTEVENTVRDTVESTVKDTVEDTTEVADTIDKRKKINKKSQEDQWLLHLMKTEEESFSEVFHSRKNSWIELASSTKVPSQLNKNSKT